MGQVISILMSYDNIYRDDTSDCDFMDTQYKSTTTNGDEFNLSINSTTTDWINFNNKKMYRDHGMEILNQ